MRRKSHSVAQREQTSERLPPSPSGRRTPSSGPASHRGQSEGVPWIPRARSSRPDARRRVAGRPRRGVPRSVSESLPPRPSPPELVEHLFPARAPRCEARRRRWASGGGAISPTKTRRSRTRGGEGRARALRGASQAHGSSCAEPFAAARALVERLLEARDVLVKAQALGGEGEGRGELPARRPSSGWPVWSQLAARRPVHSLWRRPELRATRSYQARWNRAAQVRETSPRTIEPKAPRSTAGPYRRGS